MKTRVPKKNTIIKGAYTFGTLLHSFFSISDHIHGQFWQHKSDTKDPEEDLLNEYRLVQTDRRAGGEKTRDKEGLEESRKLLKDFCVRCYHSNNTDAVYYDNWTPNFYLSLCVWLGISKKAKALTSLYIFSA